MVCPQDPQILSVVVRRFSIEELEKAEKEKKRRLTPENSGLNIDKLDKLVLRWNQLNEQTRLFSDEEFSEWSTLECFISIEKCLSCPYYNKQGQKLYPCKEFLEPYITK